LDQPNLVGRVHEQTSALGVRAYNIPQQDFHELWELEEVSITDAKGQHILLSGLNAFTSRSAPMPRGALGTRLQLMPIARRNIPISLVNPTPPAGVFNSPCK
jgi:hypothetical protein